MPCPKKRDIGFLDKVTFIRHYAVDACSTPWRVYAETGALADKNLVLGIVNTNPKDFVRFLLRPKGARTERHGISGLKTSEAAAEEEAIPDTAKLAADTIHLISGWHVPTWGEFGNALWEISQPLYRLGYYLLIANVAVDFAFDWYSGILQNPESICDQGRCDIVVGGQFGADDPYLRSVPLGAAYPPTDVTWNHTGITFEEGDWVVVLKCAAQWTHGTPGSGSILWKMMLGIGDDIQCGGAQAQPVEALTTQQHKQLVFRVTGPEKVNFHYSAHMDEPLSVGTITGTQVSAFKI